jgi:anti-anti-sigma factor
MNSIYREQGAAVLEVGGSFSSLDVQALEQLSKQLLAEASQGDPPRLVLDLTHTTFIGSKFIELLIRAWKRVKQRGGSMAMCGMQPFCVDVLRATRLDTLWPIYATRSEAVEASLSGRTENAEAEKGEG